METVPQSRRKFITTLALLLASGSLLVRYFIPRTSLQQKVVANVAGSDVPVNGALVFRNERLALLRDEKGFYSLSLVCTHLGCTVTVTEDTLSCPCHGSVFDEQGNVIKGPADKPLVRRTLVEENGMIKVFGS